VRDYALDAGLKAIAVMGRLSVGVDAAGVWGVIAGVLNTLPFVGPSVAVAADHAGRLPPIYEIEPTAAAGGVAAVVAVLEGNLLSPWLTGPRRRVEYDSCLRVSACVWGWSGTWEV